MTWIGARITIRSVLHELVRISESSRVLGLQIGLRIGPTVNTNLGLCYLVQITQSVRVLQQYIQIHTHVLTRIHTHTH